MKFYARFAFINLLTGQGLFTLPSTLDRAGEHNTAATLADHAADGWRRVDAIEEAPTGYAAIAWDAVETGDGLTCRFVVAESYNIAEAQAAAAAAAAASAAAQIASDKQSAKDLAALSGTPTGRAFQALAALLLTEINTLRTKAGLGTYTPQQFLTAWQSKVDAQS